MDLKLKIRRSKPYKLVFSLDSGETVPVIYAETSSHELGRMIEDLEWIRLSAYSQSDGLLWFVDREDWESESDSNPDPLDTLPAPSEPSPGDALLPERFLRLMILAQREATEQHARAIEILTSTLQSALERTQDALESARELNERLQEQVDELREQARESGGDTLEKLAPAVLPLLEQIGSGSGSKTGG